LFRDVTLITLPFSQIASAEVTPSEATSRSWFIFGRHTAERPPLASSVASRPLDSVLLLIVKADSGENRNLPLLDQAYARF
jgi:hypothetical protein